MILDPLDYIENARLALGSLNNIKSSAIFFSQRKTSGYRGSSLGEQIDPSNERDYGLRVWIEKPTGGCYFALLPLGDPKQLRSEISSLHKADRWKHVSDSWPFVEIEEECYLQETSYRDTMIDIIDPKEVEGRFHNLSKRLQDSISIPIKKGSIDEYLFKYRMIENEEYLWTSGSRRAISHKSSRFLIDIQVKTMGTWIGEGFEEARFLNLDWRKVSSWANRWVSRLSLGAPQEPKNSSHIYFSNYATKQICFAIHKWLLNQIKYKNLTLIENLSNHKPLNKFISLYDNPREPKVCGRRVWEGRGFFASGTKFWDEGKWVFRSEKDLPTRARGTTDIPEPTLCNLVFSPGKSDYVDTLAKAPKGFWIPSLSNAEISQDGIFSSYGFMAHYDSKLNVFPTGNVKLMAPLFDLLANIEDVGRHLQWYHSIGTSDWLVNSSAFKITSA